MMRILVDIKKAADLKRDRPLSLFPFLIGHCDPLI